MHLGVMVRKVLLVILAVLFFLSPASPALAAEPGFNLTTSPLPVLLSTKPGSQVSTVLRVQNSGRTAARLQVSLKKFRADGTTGKPLLANRGPGDDYFDWATFSSTSFTAEPGVWNEIKMTITVPPSGAFGYYYAVIFSKEGASTPTRGNANQLQGATAILVLLDVPAPGEKKQLAVASFSADKKLYEYLPTNFSVTVKNSGNIHLRPSGNIFISRGGKTIATLDVNPAAGNILPASARTFSTSWSDGFPVFKVKYDHGQIVTDKRGRPVYVLSWDFSHANRLRFGHYNAHLLLTYDNGTRDVPIEGDVSFWVVPWKILPLILLAVILIGIGLWTSLRALLTRISKRWFS